MEGEVAIPYGPLFACQRGGRSRGGARPLMRTCVVFRISRLAALRAPASQFRAEPSHSRLDVLSLLVMRFGEADMCC